MLTAHGSNGQCTGIPTDAVAVQLNVTALDASQGTFLTIWGAGGQPNASSLNPAPGQPPVPNAVTTDLTRLEATTNGSQISIGLPGANLSVGGFDRSGVVDDVDIEILEGSAPATFQAQGVGALSFSGGVEALSISNTTIVMHTNVRRCR